jgi:hypothetical protein
MYEVMMVIEAHPPLSALPTSPPQGGRSGEDGSVAVNLPPCGGDARQGRGGYLPPLTEGNLR